MIPAELIISATGVYDFEGKESYCQIFELPSDADYIDFLARVESTLHEVSDDLGFDLEPINIGGTLESGVLNLKKILPLQEVKKFIVKQ